ncbi:18932_t:CDS:2 [Gigaspora rosea]|nr:18932_t:CDS:2 [Gigaspora rosea]
MELLGELLKEKKRRYNLACGLMGGEKEQKFFLQSSIYNIVVILIQGRKFYVFKIIRECVSGGQDSSRGQVMGPDAKHFPR